MHEELQKLRELTQKITGNGYLKEQADEWEFALDAVSDLVFIVNRDNRIRFVNKALQKKLGLDDKYDVYDLNCFEIFECNNSNNSPVCRLKMQPDENKASEPYSVEVFIDSLGGWYEYTRSPILTKADKLIGHICFLRDISDLKKSEEKYRNLFMETQAQKKMLESILKAVPVGVGVVEKGTRKIKRVNQEFTKITGYTEEDIVGHSARKLYPTEAEFNRIGYEKHVKIAEEGYGSVDTKFITADGRVIDIYLSSAVIQESDDLVFTISDVTSIKKAYEDLSLSNERLNAMMELLRMDKTDEDSIIEFALEEGVRLTNSKIGYLHFVEEGDLPAEDELKLELFIWSEETQKICKAEKTRHYPLSSAGIWADAVRNKGPVVHNDYSKVENKKGLPEGHVPLDRHMAVPIIDGGVVVGVAGVGNKEDDYDSDDVRQLSLLISGMWDIVKANRAERKLELQQS